MPYLATIHDDSSGELATVEEHEGRSSSGALLYPCAWGNGAAPCDTGRTHDHGLKAGCTGLRSFAVTRWPTVWGAALTHPAEKDGSIAGKISARPASGIDLSLFRKAVRPPQTMGKVLQSKD
ncbi:MAG: hypothetical protein PWQ29_1458 [Verrucomicrobiota bacterium]|jgi:hypothetical protein|nr:hypothetical protein [Verrucomicrobiota bacterium]